VVGIKSSIFCFLPASHWFLAWLILRSWRWRQHVPLKHQLSLNGLHDIISKKIELFITKTGYL
jgi:hypothetical protein